jgi:hypothetical protein
VPNFHGDMLDVVPSDGQVHVAIRRVCEALGIAFEAQLRKLNDDPAMGVIMMIIPTDGGTQQAACLDVRSLPLWLATIHPSKVKPDAREKLIRYKRECAEVLADHFLGKRGRVAMATLDCDGGGPAKCRTVPRRGEASAGCGPGFGPRPNMAGRMTAACVSGVNRKIRACCPRPSASTSRPRRSQCRRRTAPRC